MKPSVGGNGLSGNFFVGQKGQIFPNAIFPGKVSLLPVTLSRPHRIVLRKKKLLLMAKTEHFLDVLFQ